MVSFDIFDTLITRKTILPVGTFLIMQRKIKDQGLELDGSFIDNFFDLRISAENSARSLRNGCGVEEIGIDDIYNELISMTGISRENARKIKDIEIISEIDNILPCKRNIGRLKKYYKNGHKVILISDMYLDSNVLRKLLLSVDEVFSNIPIYVSCEYNKTKSSGGIYKLVQEKEKINCQDWIHYGDNKKSDVLMPKLMGIKTNYCKIPGLEEWEEDIADKCNMKWNLDLQIFLGISRYIRQNEKLSLYSRIGASLGGMTLYPFVKWILRKCVDLQINRLYFIARDGYIVKSMTDVIIKNCQLDIKTKYFYGSRAAWKVDCTEKRALVKKYILQEVDLCDNKFAFIDIQGTGETFNDFCDIFKEFVNEPIKIFYYDIFKKKQLENCKIYNFFSNQDCIMCESVCRAPHDITIGYRMMDDKVIPVLNSDDKKKWLKCGVDEFVKGAANFAYYMSKYVDGTYINEENQQLAVSAMSYLSENPCKFIMDYFAAIPHGDIENEEQYIFAPKLNCFDIFRIFLYRTDEELTRFYKGSNLEYSIKRLNSFEHKFLKWCMKENYSFLGRYIHKLKVWNHNGICPLRKRLPKIIIYGAGKSGRELYYQVGLVDRKSIVAWVDINSSDYIKKGYPVKTIDCIHSKIYDFLVLTMKNEDTVRNVAYMLKQSGVDKDKILSIDDYYIKVLKNRKEGP